MKRYLTKPTFNCISATFMMLTSAIVTWANVQVFYKDNTFRPIEWHFGWPFWFVHGYTNGSIFFFADEAHFDPVWHWYFLIIDILIGVILVAAVGIFSERVLASAIKRKSAQPGAAANSHP